MAQKGVPLTNMSFHIFTDSENLYLSRSGWKICFPLVIHPGNSDNQKTRYSYGLEQGRTF